MAVQESYYPGGYDPASPSNNRRERLDGSVGTYTSWASDGTQTVSRPLTADEISLLAAQDAVIATGTNRASLDPKIDAAVTSLRAYIGLAAPTTAQNTAALKLVCRAVLALLLAYRNRFDDVSGT